MLITLVIVPYARVEILTNKYGDQFQDLYKQTNIISDIEYLKVLKYENDSATICYISREHQSSNVIIFVRQNEVWTLDSWDTIWSKTGTADGFSWPLYL